MEKYFAESELIINKDGSIFHLHVTPEHLADKVILVGRPWTCSPRSFSFRHQRVRHRKP